MNVLRITRTTRRIRMCNNNNNNNSNNNNNNNNCMKNNYMNACSCSSSCCCTRKDHVVSCNVSSAVVAVAVVVAEEVATTTRTATTAAAAAAAIINVAKDENSINNNNNNTAKKNDCSRSKREENDDRSVICTEEEFSTDSMGSEAEAAAVASIVDEERTLRKAKNTNYRPTLQHSGNLSYNIRSRSRSRMSLLYSTVLLYCYYFYYSSLCILLPLVSATNVDCNTTADCERLLRVGSECLPSTRKCSNPFYKEGCLARVAAEYNITLPVGSMRVCSSSDPPNAHLLGICQLQKQTQQQNDYKYPEMRFLGMNWDSAFIYTWIAQILFSELLGIPTSVELGKHNITMDFYDETSRRSYDGIGYDWEAFRNAANYNGDCHTIEKNKKNNNNNNNNNDGDQYTSCAHVGLEVWQRNQVELDALVHDEIVTIMSLGAMGEEGWYIPKFTGENDSTLLSYLGMAGEEYRWKMAETFKRPTKWIDYCNQISPNNCTTSDTVAQSFPPPGSENRYYHETNYTGYFRATEENDCFKHPFTCTGHMADFPCSWAGFMRQQAYHLKIAVESNGDEAVSNGYQNGDVADIWAAANATKSNVMVLWWTPEPLYERYLGTEAEFTRVTLPPPTLACVHNRVDPDNGCSANVTNAIGNELGACDEGPYPLLKVVTNTVYQDSVNSKVPEALRTPAYEALRNFELSELEIGTIFQRSKEIAIDPDGFDPREAACRWVAENFETVKNFIPRSYPRVIRDGDETFQDPLFYTSFIVGILALILIIVVTTLTYHQRRRRVMVMAQIEFLMILLVGLFLIVFGSFFLSIPPSNATCVLSAWFINLGYTLELTPLIVKIAALNRLLVAAKKMRRVKLERKHLFFKVAALSFGMVLYLLIWTVMDPPTKKSQYELTDTETEDGETIVEQHNYCNSESVYWRLLAISWRFLLLLSATVLAFQTRNSPQKLNESKVLAIMIYSQFVLLLLVLLLFFMESVLNVSQVSRYQSLVQSLDVSAVCCIYFVPKLLQKDEHGTNVNVSGIRSTSSGAGNEQYPNHDYTNSGGGAIHGSNHNNNNHLDSVLTCIKEASMISRQSDSHNSHIDGMTSEHQGSSNLFFPAHRRDHLLSTTDVTTTHDADHQQQQYQTEILKLQQKVHDLEQKLKFQQQSQHSQEKSLLGSMKSTDDTSDVSAMLVTNGGPSTST